jgi:predicted P-loop ATPase
MTEDLDLWMRVFDEPPPPPVSHIGKEVLTFLECAEEGKIATKRFRGPDCVPIKSASKCKWWTPRQHAVNDLWGAFELHRDLASNPALMSVRGGLLNPKAGRMLRRHKPHGAEPATLAPKLRYLNWVDFDGVEIPNLDIQNPWDGIRIWTNTIKQFKGADLIIHLSSSWALKKGVHIHSGYWTDRPISEAEARAFAESLPYQTDTSLYTPSQPFYFADPVFEKGAMVPFWDSRWSYQSVDEGTGEVHIDTGTAADELKHWLGRIAELGEGTPRHNVINSAGYFLGKYVKSGVWTVEALTEKLLEACAESGAFEENRLGAAADEIRRAVSDGMNDAVEELGTWRDRMQRKDEGGFKSTMFNLLLVLREHPALKGILRFDVRRERQEWTSAPPWATEKGETYPRPVTDSDAVEAIGWLNVFGLNFAVNVVHGAFDAVALDLPIDECVQYVNRFSWDGVERCKRLYIEGAGAEPGTWSETLGLLTMDILICRIRNWGCKADTMPILQGAEEGIGKSTFFRELVSGVDGGRGAYFSDSMGDYGSPQKFGEHLAHHLIVEDGELEKLRTREIESVMRQLSSLKDVYRPAYARKVRDKLRACLLVGTTNEDVFLDDGRMNRRLPIIKAGEMNVAWIIENRDQLFAEAAARFAAGTAKPWLNRAEIKMQVEENQIFRAEDPWTEKVLEFVEGKAEGFDTVKRSAVTASQILTDALGIAVAQCDHRQARRVGRILRKLGWSLKTVREEGRVLKRFMKGA